jgi:anaerobic ribonucleoside-triphosphate reductase activating protein
MDKSILDGTYINIASFLTKTRALGPGLRGAVWFQGCPFRCPGCISPDWIEDRQAYMYDPIEFAEFITSERAINGLTISGGEPFYQPLGLNKFLNRILSLRPELTIIVFSGYLLENLRHLPEQNRISETLSYIDILIDGLFIQKKNNNRGLRGSTNQRIHRLSGRLVDINFEDMQRINEMYFRDGYIQVSGVPDLAITQFIQTDLRKLKDPEYVRS